MIQCNGRVLSLLLSLFISLFLSLSLSLTLSLSFSLFLSLPPSLSLSLSLSLSEESVNFFQFCFAFGGHLKCMYLPNSSAIYHRPAVLCPQKELKTCSNTYVMSRKVAVIDFFLFNVHLFV